jgi:hypothetical protein
MKVEGLLDAYTNLENPDFARVAEELASTRGASSMPRTSTWRLEARSRARLERLEGSDIVQSRRNKDVANALA